MSQRTSTLRVTLWMGWTIMAVCILLALGFWQVQRLGWKEGRIAAYEQAAKLPPVSLNSLLPLTEEDNYRRVRMTGKWLRQHELHLGGRRYHTETGYHILTPFQVEDGAVYLVNRGWVSSKQKEDAARKKALPKGQVTLTGMIRLQEKQGLFAPKNHPQKNFWFRVDAAEMAKATGLKLQPLSIEIIQPDAPKDAYPMPLDGKVILRNDHLGYAITWFSLAIIAAVIGGYQRRLLLRKLAE